MRGHVQHGRRNRRRWRRRQQQSESAERGTSTASRQSGRLADDATRRARCCNGRAHDFALRAAALSFGRHSLSANLAPLGGAPPSPHRPPSPAAARGGVGSGGVVVAWYGLELEPPTRALRRHPCRAEGCCGASTHAVRGRRRRRRRWGRLAPACPIRRREWRRPCARPRRRRRLLLLRHRRVFLFSPRAIFVLLFCRLVGRPRARAHPPHEC